MNTLNYPTDFSFVELIPMPAQERLRRLGFIEPQTLFFDVPFCPVSGFGAGIIRDYAHRCYYNFFCATRGVIDGLQDDLLRVIIEHEQHEIRDATHQASESHYASAFTTLEAEARRHVPEFHDLAAKRGKDVVERAVADTARLASIYPFVPRYITLFWLTAYVVSERSHLSVFAYSMPDAMLVAEQRRRHKELLERVSKDYRTRLPWAIYSPLWIAAIKSQ